MASIVTVYNTWDKKFQLFDMSNIRWLKISEALSRLGHKVDIATDERFKWWQRGFPIRMGPNLRRIHLSTVRWHDYDLVKTLFHTGFETLESYGGTSHPFIISKLGSVVGPEDMDGIYFYGATREQLYSTQQRIAETSRYVTVLSEPAKRLWETSFGSRENVLIVPGGADRSIPPPFKDPFPTRNGTKRCIFVGNVYIKEAQPEANVVLVDKLNQLGRQLSGHSVRLFLLGPGDVTRLDPRYVTYLGKVSYDRAWDYFHFADVGIVVAAGKNIHNNESTKIYHYLRAGLPVVSEAGFPNDNIVRESGLGLVVENGNMESMAQKVIDATKKEWDRDHAIEYILNHHTWDKRVEIYDQLIRQHVN